MLEVVSIHISNLLHVVQSAYTENSFLSFGNFMIFSQEGVQQGTYGYPVVQFNIGWCIE